MGIKGYLAERKEQNQDQLPTQILGERIARMEHTMSKVKERIARLEHIEEEAKIYVNRILTLLEAKAISPTTPRMRLNQFRLFQQYSQEALRLSQPSQRNPWS
ncbi:hypothetical protein CRG98_039470 [Punica granatum]|uniref:Uncharacterized protein n=1 Tax=Punica granatum TaxID=22663 RepID=A0A2I0I8Z5_PUNGR|nr:hypothetical protein CRG98_039470 [Punica granatum]